MMPQCDDFNFVRTYVEYSTPEVAKRLASLPVDEQIYIADKYYHGHLWWNHYDEYIERMKNE